MLKPNILVIDQDEAFLQSVAAEDPQVNVITATDLKSAQMAAADPVRSFSAVCISTTLCAPHALPLVRFVKAHRPGAPMFLLSDSPAGALARSQLDSLHVHDILFKPIQPRALLQTLVPAGFFNAKDALEVSREDPTQVGEAKEMSDNKMHGIDIESFLCGNKTFFDLYIRMNDEKYLLILKAGDQFEEGRLATYIRKGTKQLFIRREAQHFYLQFCDKLTAALLASPSVSYGEKSSQVRNLGHETEQYLLKMGISQASMASAQSFVAHSTMLARQANLIDKSTFENLMDDILLADHGTSTVMLCSLMIKEMGFRDEKVINLIGVGALFHDAGLLALPEEIRRKEENVDDMTEEERAIFETHPKLGAEILMKVPHVNPLLPQIALQHHERRTRRGFPYKLGSGSISPISEMIGVIDTFLHLMKHGGYGDLTPVEVIQKHMMDDFSIKVIEAFLKTFRK